MVSWSASERRPRMATRQPCCARFKTMARPTPLPAPVITAVLIIMFFLCDLCATLRVLCVKSDRPITQHLSFLTQRTQRVSQRNAELEASDNTLYSITQLSQLHPLPRLRRLDRRV